MDSRKVAHVAANRDRIRLGRSETVVLVSVAGGVTSYQAVEGAVWYETGAVPAGISNRVGAITRVSYDAVVELPGGTAFPGGLVMIARTGTPTAGAVQVAERFQVLDKRRAGLGVVGSGGGANAGNRWMLRLRRMR